MSTSNNDEVLQSFEELRQKDAEYAKYADRFGPLAEFLVEYEHLKGLSEITQAELAEKAATSQSAISRFEAMKHPPTYDLLVKISSALGDRLFLSPAASVSMSLPYDLRDSARAAAERHGVSVSELMSTYIREALSRECFTVVDRGGSVVRNWGYKIKTVSRPDEPPFCETAEEMAG